jgi:hypothetical protein
MDMELQNTKILAHDVLTVTEMLVLIIYFIISLKKGIHEEEERKGK